MANDSSRPVLIAGWDGSDRGRDALALARVLAADRGARVVVVYAYPDYSDYALSWEASEEALQAAKYALERVPTELLDGVDVQLRSATGLSPADALQQEAARASAEMIVVGSTHHGPVGRVVPGSVAENLLYGAPCSVAVAPAGYADTTPGPLRAIEVAFDGSDESGAALDYATEMARRGGAKLRVVAVVDPVGHGWAGVGAGWAYVIGFERDYFEKALAELAEKLSPGIQVETKLREGAPADVITDEAARDIDLVVMGSRGYGPVRRVVLGSTSARVTRSAPCPVIVFPRGAVSAGIRGHGISGAAASA